MSKITTFIYGALIVLVALDAMITGFIPDIYIGFVVMALGVLVLFTHIGAVGARVQFQWIRRWIFGAVIIIIGALSQGLLGQFSIFDIFGGLTLESFWGKLVLLIIGVIYLFAAFAKTRQMQISSF